MRKTKTQERLLALQREAFDSLLNGSVQAEREKRARHKYAPKVRERIEKTKRAKRRARKIALRSQILPIDRRAHGKPGARWAIVESLLGADWLTRPEISVRAGRPHDVVSPHLAKLEEWGVLTRRRNVDFDPSTRNSWARFGRKGDRRLCEFEFRILMGREAASWIVG